MWWHSSFKRNYLRALVFPWMAKGSDMSHHKSNHFIEANKSTSCPTSAWDEMLIQGRMVWERQEDNDTTRRVAPLIRYMACTAEQLYPVGGSMPGITWLLSTLEIMKRKQTMQAKWPGAIFCVPCTKITTKCTCTVYLSWRRQYVASHLHHRWIGELHRIALVCVSGTNWPWPVPISRTKLQR